MGEFWCKNGDKTPLGSEQLRLARPIAASYRTGSRRTTGERAGHSMNIHRLIESPAQEMNANSGGTKGINSASLQIEPSVVMRGDGKSDVEVGRVGVE